MIVIDAQNARIGRVGTFAAKKLLEGEEVQIINAEEAVISGNPQFTVEKYNHRRQLQFKGNPEKSPYWPKVPDRFVKKLVRGMLPRKKATGRAAYKNLKVYMGRPKEVKGDAIRIENAELGKLTKYIKISRLCELLGYRNRELRIMAEKKEEKPKAAAKATKKKAAKKAEPKKEEKAAPKEEAKRAEAPKKEEAPQKEKGAKKSAEQKKAGKAAPKRAKKAKKKKKAVRVEHARGKRKRAIARATVKEGSGRIRVNSKLISSMGNRYFREIVEEPIALLGPDGLKVDISVKVYGGGEMGQAQACRTAIAKALALYFGEGVIAKYKEDDIYLLREDSRRVEPKKYQGPKARARKQKSYR